jgi:hypothetical protein
VAGAMPFSLIKRKKYECMTTYKAEATYERLHHNNRLIAIAQLGSKEQT